MCRIGYVGLGKMGLAQTARLLERGYSVIAWNRSPEPRREAEKLGAEMCETVQELCKRLLPPRLIWLMVPHKVVDEMLGEILPYLEEGDTIIDGGNSFYKDSIRRAGELEKKGIDFLDVGTSGGPSGARHGACLMIGGRKPVFKKCEEVFYELAAPQAYGYMGTSGAGHFVKMVHNGIEYGMMQSLAEGFSLLRAADKRGLSEPRMNADMKANGRGKIKLGLDLTEIARLYNHGSVIESRLVGWLQGAYEKYGDDLSEISGTVAHTGEGEWTVNAAKELGIQVPIIEGSFQFRVASAKNPSYTGKVLSALRNQFGGHDVGGK